MKIAFFICDCGNGHATRFIAIIERLLLLNKLKKIYIICGSNFNFIKNNISKLALNDLEIKYLVKDSVFSWFPGKDGCPNEKKLKSYYDKSFLERIEKLIEEESKSIKGVDIIVNDGMPYANMIAKNLKIKSFSIFHFQWSWFLNKCHFSLVPDYVLKKINFYEKNSTLNFCSEFTPGEIKNKLKNTVIIEPIIRNDIKNLKDYEFQDNDIFNISIIDSGANLSSQKILSILNNPYFLKFRKIKKIVFNVFTGINYEIKNRNEINFYKNLARKDFLIKLKKSRLVIARPGFNLLSELIYLNKPCLFFCENGNPEMVDTIYQIAKKGINNILPDDYEQQYYKIGESLNSNKNIYSLTNVVNKFDGASKVADYIINL